MEPGLLGETETVVKQVLRELGHKLPSVISRELARGSVLVVLQRMDLLDGRAPRALSKRDQQLLEWSLRNADEYQHDEWPE